MTRWLRHLDSRKRLFAGSMLLGHSGLLVVLASLLKRTVPAAEAIAVACIATALVFGASATLTFLSVFRKTLVPGIAMDFIRGPEPHDPDERWAWYWGKSIQAAVWAAISGAVLLWIVRSAV